MQDRIYLDESGIDQHLYGPLARSVVGTPVFGAILGKQYQRESFIAAKAGAWEPNELRGSRSALRGGGSETLSLYSLF